MIYPVVIYLIDLTTGRSREWFIATVMACGFITFHSMPEAVPFLVRLATVVVVQFAVGRAMQLAE